MKFSLINVRKQEGRTVEGNWIQNHVGTLETATAAARRTEAANGGKITVAVVEEVSSSVPILSYWEHLTRLDLNDPRLELETSINGQPAEWTREIWQLWYTHVDVADPKLYDTHGVVTSANYFTPRPYKDQYDRGDRKEGFTFTVAGREVYQCVIRGGVPFLIAPQQKP